MNHDEWRRWRHKAIGGSDAPIIMGDSPHKTPLQLYEEMILPEPPPEEDGFVTARGHRMETRIRAIVSMEHGVEYDVALCQSSDEPWRITSLDGRSPDKDVILEIKTNDKKAHETTKQGKVPMKHWAQVQHALDISGAKCCWYVSYNDPEWDEKRVSIKNMAFVRVFPNPQYLAILFEAEYKFYHENVLKKKPPQPIEGDYIKLRAKGLTAKARRYKQIKKKIDELEFEKKQIREEIIELAKSTKEDHPRFMAYDLKVLCVPRAGSINYSKVPELKGVDLNPYRKKGSITWRIE